MSRLRGIVLLLVLLALVGRMIFLAAVPPAVPFAAEDENGVVLLWPGSAPADPPAVPVTMFAPCPLGPQNFPKPVTENDT